MSRRKILILANNDMGLYKFRKELLKQFLSEFEVHIAVPSGDFVNEMMQMGCKFHKIEMERRGKNLLKDLKLFLNYKKKINEIKPDYILTYTIKPNIYGGIAARLAKIPYFVNITGLGSVFESDNILKSVVLKMYYSSLKEAEIIFFQNVHNQKVINQSFSLKSRQELLPGSGINLHEYQPLDYPANDQEVRFLFIGRLMNDKGIRELVQAFVRLKNKFPHARLTVIGFKENNFNFSLFEDSVKAGLIEYDGLQNDVRPYLEQCHAVINPSYHEGMSNVLLEACACQRPCLASDIPGCCEIVSDYENGFLFNKADVDSLERAMTLFCEAPYEEKQQMAEKSRQHVEKNFDRNIIIEKYMNELGGQKNERVISRDC